MLAWAQSNAVGVIDLTAEVSAHDAAAITLRDGIHFNTLGNRLLADSIERRLVDEYLSGNRNSSEAVRALGFENQQQQ
jgi:hypothetical protein